LLELYRIFFSRSIIRVPFRRLKICTSYFHLYNARDFPSVLFRFIRERIIRAPIIIRRRVVRKTACSFGLLSSFVSDRVSSPPPRGQTRRYYGRSTLIIFYSSTAYNFVQFRNAFQSRTKGYATRHVFPKTTTTEVDRNTFRYRNLSIGNKSSVKNCSRQPTTPPPFCAR